MLSLDMLTLDQFCLDLFTGCTSLQEIKSFFFFARDGYVAKKVYDILYPECSTDYIYLSRRALSVPLLWKHSDWDEFSHYITVTRFFTVRVFRKIRP